MAGKSVDKKVGRRIQDLFWENTIPIPETGCFLWARKINPNGYGSLRRNRLQILAHRAAWELVNGKIPEGLL